MSGEFLTMGFPAASDANLRGEFATLLGELAEVEVAVTEAPTYEKLAVGLDDGSTQIAWLSPLPYIALSNSGRVMPLVYNERLKKHYCSAIIVPADSHVKRLVELKGARAAWVDRHSAAGYVMPRIQLAQAGVDPRRDLAEQTFAGSHDAVAQMVATNQCDFGATFAHKVDGKSYVIGPFSTPEREERVRVLQTFGKIPSDLIVARNDVDMAVRTRLTRALRAMNTSETGRRIIHELFDVHRFRLLDAEAYETLQSMARNARDQGLLS